MNEIESAAAFEAANKITFTQVETRSRTRMFRVERAGQHLGLIEKMPEDASTRTPWKAFLGMGVGCKYLGAHFGRNGKDRAVAQIVRAAAGIFVGTEVAIGETPAPAPVVPEAC
jgi:hypothetical protein